MLSKAKTLTVLLVCTLGTIATASFDSDKTAELVRQLTNNAQNSWIDAGVIQANHLKEKWAKETDESVIQQKIEQEIQAYQNKTDKNEATPKAQQDKLEAIPFNVRYHLSNESEMSSDVTLKFNNGKFYWQIDAVSRHDSISVPAELQNNEHTINFKMFSNQKRIFSWDGDKYIRYFRPINHAIITAEAGNVNGPLTAGIVRWGYGEHSFESLSAATVSTEDITVNGKNLIKMTISNGNIEEVLTIDPAMNNAVIAVNLARNNSVKTVSCSNYQQFNNKWIPLTIVIENKTDTDKLLSRDTWNITSVNLGSLTNDDFKVAYDTNAFIEDFRYGQPIQYRYNGPDAPSAKLDYDQMISDYLRIASMAKKPNCAAIALKFVAEKLGTPCQYKDIAKIMPSCFDSTTMGQLKSAIEKIGFNTFPAKLSINTLKNLKNSSVIVYLANQKHFVVVSKVCDNKISLIDLGSHRFLYNMDIDRFSRQWDGSSLIVSKSISYVNLPNAVKITAADMSKIAGTGNCSQCNTVMQHAGEISCTSSGSCGSHIILYDRLGCGGAKKGSCSNSATLLFSESEGCSYYDEVCHGDGDWTSNYGGACG